MPGRSIYPDPFLFVEQQSFRPLDGLSRPVPDDLVDTGKLVKYRILPDIYITCMCDYECSILNAFILFGNAFFAPTTTAHPFSPLRFRQKYFQR